MLYLVIVFGDALDDRVGLWTWPFLLGLIVALAFMRYRVFTFRETAKAGRSRCRRASALRTPARDRRRATARGRCSFPNSCGCTRCRRARRAGRGCTRRLRLDARSLGSLD